MLHAALLLSVAVGAAEAAPHAGVRATEQAAAHAALRADWRTYVTHWISEDGRVLDRAEAERTTSEGQSYALVRAVWADDRATFERVRAWTRDNLQGGDPSRLPAWSWGRRSDETWGVLDEAPASDADQWVAWALLGASARWHDTSARDDARVLLASIWEQETDEVAGARVLLPGPWARPASRRPRDQVSPTQLNPSYWLPFAWRAFAEADPDHDWQGMIGPAYELLEACVGATGLATDWCYVDPMRPGTGVVAAPRGREAHDDFGFEAMRIPWTLAAEVRWHNEPRAARLLRPYTALGRAFLRDGSVPAVRAWDGRARVPWDYVGLYGALLPVWELRLPGAAADAWAMLEGRRGPHGWGETIDYYGQNLVWMGQALRVGLAGKMLP
jgi:endo-1,4-beta-D-glucanase Y